MAAFDMNKDPYFHYKILFPDSMSGSFKNNELEKIVDQLLICISQHCSEPGSISGAKEINDKIEEIFQYLEIPIIFGDHRERARFMTKRDRMAEEASIEVTENIAETLHLYRVISDVKSPLEVWKIGLDLVDHDMAYFINTAITIIGSYDDNFLSKVVQKLDFDSLEGLDKEEADRHLYKEYRECLSSYASKGIKIKKWVDSMTTI